MVGRLSSDGRKLTSALASMSVPSVFPKGRAIGTVTSDSLSSVRNGGKGRGEETLRHGATVGKCGAPLSPFVPHGEREADALLIAAVAHTLSQRLIASVALVTAPARTSHTAVPPPNN